MKQDVAVIGAGFAGSEAVWQLARRGVPVTVYEMRPERMTEAHQGGDFAELVCSNSFKSVQVENAHGLLKAELRLQGSLILDRAGPAAVPAGQALAVDREVFSQSVTRAVASLPQVRVVREEVSDLELLLKRHAAVIVASGPLTSPALSRALTPWVGAECLYFHDAIAPVVTADSIDMGVAFRASRYGKGEADYLNCPLSREQYLNFVRAVAGAEKVAFHAFEDLRPFEGCLPIEVMVERGEMTLAFGPMKPVGLPDPRTGHPPFAVVQLRQDNLLGSLYSLVGFQTKMTWPEQRRVFRQIPGLEQAEFARLGSLHRNTFLNAPRLLDETLALRSEPRLVFAGQITGVEGYMESTAMGLYAAKQLAARLTGRDLPRPSPNTLTGALVRYLVQGDPVRFQPINVSFGLLDPLEGRLGKKERKAAQARRALEEMERLQALENPPPASLAEAPWQGSLKGD
ncbi:MAG: methylenetetrahydrofolate--tRNA-(uracil(54)-C(5))-methyltransferase (FADH(2)-oxidizing) TrmFO [Deltaproteobacteria bacterium]|nr:methylenetetrahydrofolate--tRNA-(uracil(54)-C(5))-methyltransferase (FADH(2)-oxidizing) TrmFO [Deltaproteobacteria bacterium]